MDAEERLIELFKVGCPKCKQKDSFFLDSTEQIRRRVSPDPEDREFIQYGDTDYIDTVSEDFIICPNCFWEEAPEEGKDEDLRGNLHHRWLHPIEGGGRG